MNFTIKSYSILMTIGPSNCGKTTFCENFLVPFLKTNNISHNYFSSDAIRRDLIGVKLSKYNSQMLTVTKKAFEILEEGVSQSCLDEIKVIIVDATFLTYKSRRFIKDIARRNAYQLLGILFDYTDSHDYFKYLRKDANKKVVQMMFTTFKEKTRNEIKKDGNFSIFEFDSIDSMEDVNFIYQEVKRIKNSTVSIFDNAPLFKH